VKKRRQNEGKTPAYPAPAMALVSPLILLLVNEQAYREDREDKKSDDQVFPIPMDSKVDDGKHGSHIRGQDEYRNTEGNHSDGPTHR